MKLMRSAIHRVIRNYLQQHDVCCCAARY